MKNQAKLNDKRKISHWAILLALAAILLVGGVVVEPIGLTRRGIVVGMSVDKTATGYRVAVQLVSVASGDPQGKASSYVIVEGQGGSVAAAMDAIAYRSSLLPSYGHCKVLFVGENVLPYLDEIAVGFLRKDTLSQDTQIVAVQGQAVEALAAKVPLLDSSSTYVEQDNLLVSQTGGRNLVSLKDYCGRVDGKSGAKLLPYAVKIATRPDDGEETPEETSYLFDLYNTVAYDGAGVPHVYGHEVTAGVGLVNAKGGQITAYREDGRYVTVKILTVTKSRSYTEDTVKGSYCYTVSVVEQTISPDAKAEEIASMVAAEIDRMILAAFETARADGVDVFGVAGRLYWRYGKVLPLDQVKWERSIKVICQ